jgi:hypothetical protein
MPSCCLVCLRTPSCPYWASTPEKIAELQKGYNGCELYFDSSTLHEDIPMSKFLIEDRQQQQSCHWLNYATEIAVTGSIKGSSKEVSFFLGCG